jgi:hypothetical protein
MNIESRERSHAIKLYAPEWSASIKAMSRAPQSRFCCRLSNIFDGCLS